MMPIEARLVAVNVVAEIHPGIGRPVKPTAIDKRPVAGRVAVGPLGVEGDRQINRRHHGGPDKAVYAFAREDVEHWAVELDRDLPPGSFGDNLSTVGLEVSNALVGERWRIGSGADATVVEVTMPRVPCANFARWLGDPPRWVKRFTVYGRVGSYLRVVTPGVVGAGDQIEVIHRPDHGVSAGDVLRGLSPEQAQALLAAHRHGDVALAPEVAAQAAKVAATVALLRVD